MHPGQFVTSLPTCVARRWLTVCVQTEFSSLLKAINCYFPDSDYPTHVYPRVQAQMVRLFDRLVARGVVKSIRLKSGGWTAQWPCWTKNWLEPD